MKFAVALCVILAAAAQPGAAQVTLSPPPPVAATPPPPPTPVASPPPPVVAQPPPAVPPVTAAPPTAPVVTAAPAPQAMATPPVAPSVPAVPAPKAVATPPAPAPTVAPPVVTAAPAPKVAATPPTTAAPAKAAPAPAPAAPVAKMAPAPAPAVLPAVLPFPRAPTPAPAPATPPRQCSNGPPRCQIFVEDALCCGSAEGLTTDSHYLTVDVLCTEYVVIPVGCLTVSPVLTNISVYTAFQPAGASSTFHDFVVDFQKDADFEAGPYVGRVDLSLEALRNVSGSNYNPTCALNISPCLYNGTTYTNITTTNQLSVTVMDNLDFQENYLGIPATNTDTLGWAPTSNPSVCQQADIGMLNASFYTGGFVNYTGYQNACNTTRTQLDSYQFCEDYVLPFENRTLHNLPSAPAPRLSAASLGPSSKDSIPL